MSALGLSGVFSGIDTDVLLAYAMAAAPKLIAALTEIACFNDQGACRHLGITGSYALFDDPASVKAARAALAAAKVPDGE